MTRRSPDALVLDEMVTPSIAEELHRRGHDVIAVAADPRLRSVTDTELYEWAAQQHRRIVTENVKDFRPLLVHAGSPAGPGVLFTSNRTFPRSRRSVGLLVSALDHWLRQRGARRPEEWLDRAPR